MSWYQIAEIVIFALSAVLVTVKSIFDFISKEV